MAVQVLCSMWMASHVEIDKAEVEAILGRMRIKIETMASQCSPEACAVEHSSEHRSSVLWEHTSDRPVSECDSAIEH